MTIKAPTLSAKWDLWGEELPVVTRKVNGRTLTIRPRELSIHASRADLSDLSVHIQGTTIKANGSDGQHRRSHSFYASPFFDGWPTLDDLPAWARPYLEYARGVLGRQVVER
ncbi:MAG: hypothetical protein K0S37_774 [Microbacterium sp.]|jgi:hypothetical protein|nr:hypothetical protein [Microbacterium sp.]